MSQYYDLNNTGPQVQDRLDQTQENKQDIATLEEKVTAIENEIGESGQGGSTINARLDALETAVGSGGSVDERIAAAETEIIGGASSDYNTLGKVEGELEDTYRKNETYSKTELDNLITTPNVLYVTVIATSGTTDVTTLLPATGAADTVYRVGNWDGTQYDPTMYALFAWNGTTYVCLAVRSFVGEVYDVSVNHPDGQGNPTPYADLTTALGTSGANIPADIRRGGMSIKFIQGNVQSSDNKYIQARCTANEFTTDITKWQVVDEEEPKEGSHNIPESGVIAEVYGQYTEDADYIYAITDSQHRLIVAITKNGEPVFGVGLPQQLRQKIEEILVELKDELVETYGYYSEESDNIEMKLDKSNKVLSERKKDGTLVEKVGLVTKYVEAEKANIIGGRIVVDSFGCQPDGAGINGGFRFEDEDGNIVAEINGNACFIKHLLLKSSKGKTYEISINDTTNIPQLVFYEI